MPNIIQQPNTVTNVFDQAANKTLLNLLNSIDKLHNVNTNLSSGSDSSTDILRDISKKMSNAQTADSIAGKDANKRNRVAQNLMNENAVKSRKSVEDFKKSVLTGLTDLGKFLGGIITDAAKRQVQTYHDFAKQMREMRVDQTQSKQFAALADEAFLRAKNQFGINLDKKQTFSDFGELMRLQKGFDQLLPAQQTLALVLKQSGKTAEAAFEIASAIKVSADENDKSLDRVIQAYNSGANATARFMHHFDTLFTASDKSAMFKNNTKDLLDFQASAAEAFTKNMATLNEETAGKLMLTFTRMKAGKLEDDEPLAALVQTLGGNAENLEQFVVNLRTAIETNTIGDSGQSFDDFMRVMQKQNPDIAKSLNDLRLQMVNNGKLITQQLPSTEERRKSLESITPNGKLNQWLDNQGSKLNLFTGGLLSNVITDLDSLFGGDMEAVVSQGFSLVVGLLTALIAKDIFKLTLSGIEKVVAKLTGAGAGAGAAKAGAAGAAGAGAGAAKVAKARKATKPPKAIKVNKTRKTVKARKTVKTHKVAKPATTVASKKAAEKAAENTLEKTAGKTASKFLTKATFKTILGGLSGAGLGILAADLVGQAAVSKILDKGGYTAEALSDNIESINKWLPSFVDSLIVSKETLALIKTNFDGSIQEKAAKREAEILKAQGEQAKSVLSFIQDEAGVNDKMWSEFTSSLEGLDDSERMSSLVEQFDKYGRENIYKALAESNNMEEFTQHLANSSLSMNVKKIADNFNVKLGSVYDRVNEIQEKVAPYANGTIATRPTFGLFGEDGREAILPLTKKDKLKEIVGALSEQDRANIVQAIHETSSSQMPVVNASSTTPGDDIDSINKTLSFARPEDRLRLYNAMVAGMSKRHQWYQESLNNAGATEGRDLIKGTYAERALAYGVMELGKPYLLRSIGRIGYVCNELTDAALRKSGFDMRDFALHKVSTTFANLVSGKMFNGKKQVPAFRLRPDITPETAYPGMVFFQTNKGRNEPGHIGLVYYGHQRLHSSGGAKDFTTKDGFLSSWLVPSRGVTINEFDKTAKYDFAEFPGLFAKANGAWPDWYNNGIPGDTFENKNQMDYSHKPNFVTNAMYAEAIRRLETWQGGRMKPAEFISLFGPIATEDMRRTGIPASITLAQAALESGWGKTAKAEFRNLFGIKGRGNAGSAYVSTHEVRPGNIVEYKKDYFAQYATYLDSINAHSSYLLNAKRKKGLNGLRYGEALLNVFNPDMFAHKIKEGGYATSPTYAEKLISIMRSNKLYDWDLGPNDLALQGVGDTQMALINQAKSNASSAYTPLNQQSNLQNSAKEAIANAVLNKQNLSHKDIVDIATKLNSADIRTLIAAIHEVRDELRKGTRSYSAASTPLSVYA